MKAPLPANEAMRLAALRSYVILDTAPEGELDDITALAAEMLAAPIALISLVDEDRQWFKSRVGLEMMETPRDMSFCAHALEMDGMLVVGDAARDARFADNPLVTGAPHVRFYAGTPLRTAGGETLGTLCVIDRVPRTLDRHQQHLLETLGRQVMTRLELNRQVRELEHTKSALLGMMKEQRQTEQQLRESEERWQFALDGNDQGVWDWNLQTNEIFYSERWCTMLGYAAEEIAPRLEEWTSRVHLSDLDRAETLLRDHLDGISPFYVCEHRLRAKDGTWLWIHARGKITARHAEGRPLRIVGTATDITEQKQREKALAQSQMLQRIAGRAAKMGGWSVTVPDFELTFSDETAALHDEVPGFAPTVGQAIGYYVPQHRDHMRDAFEACAKDGTPFDVEAQLVTAKGRHLWVRSIGEAVRSSAGSIVRVQGALQDISALKEAAQSLAESQRRFRLLADAMPFVVWTAEPEGVVDFTNRGFYDYTGQAQEAGVLPDWASYLHPEDQERCMAAWLECIREEKPYSIEYRVRQGSDGCYRWFRIQALPVWDVTGRLTKWYGAGIDIHDTKRLELEATRMAERLSTTLESITDVFFTVDREWRLTYVNTEAEQLVHKTREEMMGRNFWELFPRAVGTPFEHHYRRAMAENVTVGAEEFYAPLGRWLELRAYPSGEGLTVHLRDVTERKKHEQHLNTLSMLGQQLNVVGSPGEAGRIIAELADGLFGWDATTLDLYSCETGLMTPVLMMDTIDGVRADCLGTRQDQSPSVLARRVLTEGAQLLLDGTGEGAGRRFGDTARPSASLMLVPIRDGTRSIGMLTIQSYRTNAYSQQDLHLLQLMADYCGGALQRIHMDSLRRISEDRFHLLAKATNDTIWDWDIQANRLWWNEGFELMFGFDRATVEPDLSSWTSRIHPDDLKRIQQAVHLALEGDAATWVGEYRFACRDGSYAYVLDRGYIIRDAEGKAVRMIGGMTDLTERRKTEEQLRQQAALLDKAQEAILVRDMDHTVLYWNKSAERLYGWPAEEACGKNIAQLLYREPAEFFSAMQETLAQGEWCGEIEQVKKDGTGVVVEGHWTLVRDEQGVPKSVLAINTDMTERKKLERQSLRAQRMESIGTLAGGIAHDLNNVLAPILMSIDLLRMQETHPRRLSVLGTIEESAKRGADMVRQLLSFARGVEGQQMEVDVGRLLGEIEKITNETFLKNIEVRSHVPAEGLWSVIGDPTQLHQVLLNLCVNARDAMPSGGRLTLHAENLMLDEHYAMMNKEARPGAHICLQVEDTGMGMPADVVERIFEPFFTTKEVGKGTGLGLSTTLAIVKSHGGFLRVYSEPGRGTKFCVYLPARTQCCAPREADKPPELPRGNNERVLVIDDEAPVREITRETLESFGYRVLLACDGADATALYAVHKHDIHVVLTDMMMPAMDGPTTIQVLKRMNARLPIIGASGLNVNALVAKAVNAGVNHFIPKPYTAETLLITLRKVLTELPSAVMTVGVTV